MCDCVSNYTCFRGKIITGIQASLGREMIKEHFLKWKVESEKSLICVRLFATP